MSRVSGWCIQMTKHCVICDRTIRTGRKYCFEHRNTRIKEDDEPITFMDCVVYMCIILFIIFLIIMSIKGWLGR